MPRKKKSETENSEEETEDLEGKDLVKEAEKESTISEKELEEKKKKLLEKVKALSSKVDVAVTEDLKEKVKIKKRTDMLVPLEDYVKTGIYIGTRVVTPIMKQFVYR